MARRTSIFSQIAIDLRALNANLRGINNAATHQQARGMGLAGMGIGSQNPFNLNNLTSVQFWSDVIRKQDQVRIRALALNTTPQALAAAAGTGVGRAGFTNAVTNQMEMLSMGLDQHLEGTKELGLQMKLTGQNETKLYQTMRQSQIIGGLNNKEMENLSNHMMDLGKTYNISTEALVESMQDIASNMDVAALGQTEQYATLNQNFTAKFSAGASQILSKMEANLAAGQTFVTDQIVGAFDGLGDSLDSATEYTKKYAVQFGNFLNQFPIQMRAKGLEIAKGIFGEQGYLAYTLNNAMQKMNEAGPTGEAQDKFSSLQTAMAALYTPIESLSSKVIPFLSDKIGLLTTVLIAAQATSLISGAIGAFGGIGAILPAIAAFLPEILIAGAGLTVLGVTLGNLLSNSEDQTKSDKERLEIEKTRERREIEKSRKEDQLNTSKYMELQAQALNDSLDMIMFGTDMSRRLASESDKEKIRLSQKLIEVIARMEKPVGQARASMDGGN